MTSPRRFESDLPAMLADLYLAGIPDYRDDLVRQTARVRQRPAWTFPERWLPVELVTTRVPVTRLPIRQLGVLALIAILLAAMLAAYIGSRQQRLPPPFGVAANGLIAYSRNGDIFAVDPATGSATAVVGGPESDRRPMFSADGTRMVFLRARPDLVDRFDLVVAEKDGRGVKRLAAQPVSTDDTVEWAPDGTYVLLNAGDGDLVRIDAIGTEPPRGIARGVHISPGSFRPPDGAQILYAVDKSDATTLWVMDADGSNARLLLERPAPGAIGAIDANIRWSPDGRMIALGIVGPMADGNMRIHVMNADGTGLHQVGDATGIWVENDVVWSPDSTHVAFNRWRPALETGGWEILPVGVAPAVGGAIRDLGPTPASEGAILEFSPDGTKIVAVSGPFVGAPTDGSVERPMIIDAANGTSTRADWEVASATSWQRIAP
jgi:Tol biopolymer transport system component